MGTSSLCFPPSFVFLPDWIREKRINEFCCYGDCVLSIKTACVNVTSSCCNLSFRMKSTSWSAFLAVPFLDTRVFSSSTLSFFNHHTSEKYLVYHEKTWPERQKRQSHPLFCFSSWNFIMNTPATCDNIWDSGIFNDVYKVQSSYWRWRLLRPDLQNLRWTLGTSSVPPWVF